MAWSLAPAIHYPPPCAPMRADVLAALPTFEHDNLVACRYIHKPLLIDSAWARGRRARAPRGAARRGRRGCPPPQTHARPARPALYPPNSPTHPPPPPPLTHHARPGFKFDLRLYLLVRCVDPAPRAFLHREGLVRRCTRPYARPAPPNLADPFCHLTNYAGGALSSLDLAL